MRLAANGQCQAAQCADAAGMDFNALSERLLHKAFLFVFEPHRLCFQIVFTRGEIDSALGQVPDFGSVGWIVELAKKSATFSLQLHYQHQRQEPSAPGAIE
jgi:hypothetical protein